MSKRNGRMVRSLFAVLVAATIVVAVASAQLVPGELSPAGCISETGTGGDCTAGKALDGAGGVAVSRDGKHVYAASAGSNAVGVFSRDKTTGALTQLAGLDGCVSETGSGGDCADGKALETPNAAALSPDGRNVYVASLNSSAVAVFARDAATGVLTQLAGNDGCVNEGGVICTDGKALNGASDVAVSPDGKNVYVASLSSGAVAVFARNTATGVLTQLGGTAGCVSDDGTGGDCVDGKALAGAYGVAVSPEGKNVYVASFDSDAVAVFARNKKSGALTQVAGTAGCVSETGSGGDCADGKALDGPTAVTLTTDGRHVYVSSVNSDAVAVFARNKKTRALTQLAGTGGCISENGSGGDCIDGKALDGAYDVAVGRDGSNVYVASDISDAVAAFRKDTKTGALTEFAGQGACISEDGSGGDCLDGTALDAPVALAATADGKHVYVAAGISDAVVVLARV